MFGISTKYWAIGITAALHLVMLAYFAVTRIDFYPDNQWTHVKMSFQEEEAPKIEKEEQWIPENYEEHGLDQKKYSVAKTNEAVNEALDQLSKGEQEKLDREIEAQVNQMAKESSTSGFMEGNSSNSGNITAGQPKPKTEVKKAGSEKGKEELGNIHEKATNISFYLKNRVVAGSGLYNPVYLCQDGGKVVVNIVVNKDGLVVSAQVNEVKSAGASSCLKAAAKKAALRSEFNQDYESDNRQRGIITYTFVAQ